MNLILPKTVQKQNVDALSPPFTCSPGWPSAK